jgi:hypothetical protein
MPHANTIGEAIDELERIQGEPLSLQRSLEKLEAVEVSRPTDTPAGSSFRSHFGHTGKETAQIFPLGPGEKNVVSKCIILDPYIRQEARGGAEDSASNKLSIFWDIILRCYAKSQNE